MDYNRYLMHHGIKGMHWGVRRYQNPDGSLTEAGKKRYSQLVTPEGNYTSKAIASGFPNKVEKGVARYVQGRKVKDPMVQEVIRQNKAEIDAMIAAESNRIVNQQMLQNQQTMEMQRNAEYAMREAQRASNRAASLSISNGTNPFMFGP